jgi:hypothetical protein
MTVVDEPINDRQHNHRLIGREKVNDLEAILATTVGSASPTRGQAGFTKKLNACTPG